MLSQHCLILSTYEDILPAFIGYMTWHTGGDTPYQHAQGMKANLEDRQEFPIPTLKDYCGHNKVPLYVSVKYMIAARPHSVRIKHLAHWIEDPERWSSCMEPY